MGYPKLMLSCWGYHIAMFMQVCGGGLRGMRKATTALVCNACGSVIPRLFWVWLVVPMMHTPTMLYLIYPISWTITSVMTTGAFYYYRKKLAAELPAPMVK